LTVEVFIDFQRIFYMLWKHDLMNNKYCQEWERFPIELENFYRLNDI